jgi:hypothetical protein
MSYWPGNESRYRDEVKGPGNYEKLFPHLEQDTGSKVS